WRGADGLSCGGSRTGRAGRCASPSAARGSSRRPSSSRSSAMPRSRCSSSSSIEGTYDRYQQFAVPGRNLIQEDATVSNDEDPSNMQSRLSEIAAWSLDNNADNSDASSLEKLEKLLKDALRITESKKTLVKQNSGGSTSGESSYGPTGQENGRKA
ncbi:hypothetical protein CFC21_037636, partial [Triticum aestivum]